MEDKNLTEKESLELIARMIKETQNNVARYAAYPLLIWGYLTTFIAVVVWFAIFKYEFYQIQYLWWSLPVIAFPLTIYFSRKSGKRGAQTYMDRITNRVWGIFGCVGFLLSFFAFFQAVDIYFLIPLLMGMGVAISGCVTKYNPMIVLGIVGIALSFSLLFIHGLDRLLIFAAIFVVMMIIPGHLLNEKMKQECLKS
ncbi:hypothetical protein [Parabacteroides sp. ZJ-118]|uniref:hypothetical protein n=1 Tax=Parabacteroides sp. ZJ-118 TaxID=2709398 RepID=UPI0013EC00B4|nr:hypothetical protein [Parabacteroides sp. ZJ-118]